MCRLPPRASAWQRATPAPNGGRRVVLLARHSSRAGGSRPAISHRSALVGAPAGAGCWVLPPVIAARMSR